MSDTQTYEKILRDRQRELESRLSRIDGDLGRTKEQDSDDRAVESENDEVLEGLGQSRPGRAARHRRRPRSDRERHVWHLRPLRRANFNKTTGRRALCPTLRGLHGPRLGRFTRRGGDPVSGAAPCGAFQAAAIAAAPRSMSRMLRSSAVKSSLVIAPNSAAAFFAR